MSSAAGQLTDAGSS